MANAKWFINKHRQRKQMEMWGGGRDGLAVTGPALDKD